MIHSCMHSQPRSRILAPRCRGLNGWTHGVLAVQPVSLRREVDVHPKDIHGKLRLDPVRHAGGPGGLPDAAVARALGMTMVSVNRLAVSADLPDHKKHLNALLNLRPLVWLGPLSSQSGEPKSQLRQQRGAGGGGAQAAVSHQGQGELHICMTVPH